jgi:hypothetical protein
MTTCEHGTPINEDCAKCRAILSARRPLLKRYDIEYYDGQNCIAPDENGDYVRFADAQAEIQRLLNIIKGCPVCSDLERNINTKPKDRP